MHQRWLDLDLDLDLVFARVSRLSLSFAPAAIAAGVACNTAALTPPQGSTSGGPTSEVVGPNDAVASAADGGAGIVAEPRGGAVVTSMNVTIQVEPSDLGAQIEASIRAAETSVHMTMYLLTNTAIIDALGDLKDAGKDVQVVLNKTFPPDGGDNAPAFAKLQARGVNVVYAPSAYTYTHAKTVILDHTKMLIMTMNLTQTSAKDNREYIATDSDPEDVADGEKIFAADHSGSGVGLNGKLVVSPEAAQPTDPRTRLTALMDSAKTSLDVEVQSLSDDALTGAIIRAHHANVAVRVVLSGAPGETVGEKDAIAKLSAAGVPLKGVVIPYIHAKAIVVDGATVYVGSQNFTLTALDKNREVGVVTDAPGEAAKVETVIASDFASGAAL